MLIECIALVYFRGRLAALEFHSHDLPCSSMFMPVPSFDVSLKIQSQGHIDETTLANLPVRFSLVSAVMISLSYHKWETVCKYNQVYLKCNGNNMIRCNPL